METSLAVPLLVLDSSVAPVEFEVALLLELELSLEVAELLVSLELPAVVLVLVAEEASVVEESKVLLDDADVPVDATLLDDALLDADDVPPDDADVISDVGVDDVALDELVAVEVAFVPSVVDTCPAVVVVVTAVFEFVSAPDSVEASNDTPTSASASPPSPASPGVGSTLASGSVVSLIDCSSVEVTLEDSSPEVAADVPTVSVLAWLEDALEPVTSLVESETLPELAFELAVCDPIPLDVSVVLDWSSVTSMPASCWDDVVRGRVVEPVFVTGEVSKAASSAASGGAKSGVLPSSPQPTKPSPSSTPNVLVATSAVAFERKRRRPLWVGQSLMGGTEFWLMLQLRDSP